MLVFHKELASSTQPTAHIQPDHWFYKRSAEHFPIQIEFANIVPTGGAITAGSVICRDSTGVIVTGIATFDEVVSGTTKTQILIAGGSLSASWYKIYCRGTLEVSGDPDSEYEVLVKMNVTDNPAAGDEVTFGGEDVTFGGEEVTFGVG